jgi:hypothetical protein
MSTRISDRLFRVSPIAFVLLGACNVDLPDKVEKAREQAHEQALASAEGKMECAVGDKPFERVCAIDRVQSQDGLYLTLRHPDGGFRRLLVTKDGRGVIAADGAEPAVVSPIAANQIEVTLGDMHYRLPATVKGYDKK